MDHGLREQLDAIVATDARCTDAAIVARWKASGVGVEALEPIFDFFETYPSVEHGSPGALVHFAERFLGSGYETRLLQSLARKPTPHTAWMMNRLINGTSEPALKLRYLQAMTEARHHKSADAVTQGDLQRFLEFQAGA